MIIAKKAVRCKDCKYFVGGGEINHGCGLCMKFNDTFYHSVDVKENEFCSKGEYGRFMDMEAKK